MANGEGWALGLGVGLPLRRGQLQMRRPRSRMVLSTLIQTMVAMRLIGRG